MSQDCFAMTQSKFSLEGLPRKAEHGVYFHLTASLRIALNLLSEAQENGDFTISPVFHLGCLSNSLLSVRALANPVVKHVFAPRHWRKRQGDIRRLEPWGRCIHPQVKRSSQEHISHGSSHR